MRMIAPLVGVLSSPEEYYEKRREISVMYEISTRTLQRYVDAYNECGMDAEPQGGLTYGLLPTTEDRATLGSDLSASWDFAGSICSLYLKLTSSLGGVSLFSADLSLTKYSACP